MYDAAQDCYYCPQGRMLEFAQLKTRGRNTCDDSEYRVYKCLSCEGCGLAGDCLAGNCKRRTVSHDQHEAVRQEAAARLKTEPGRKAYARWAHLAETPNVVIKQVLGLRQFLSRGLDKVRSEWLWACTAFNIRKLIGAVEILRAQAEIVNAQAIQTGLKGARGSLPMQESLILSEMRSLVRPDRQKAW